MESLDNKINLGIVGFSRVDEENQIISKFGELTNKKIRLIYGFTQNESQEYSTSFIHLKGENSLREETPFWSIAGIEWYVEQKKFKNWGINTEDKYLLWEGYNWFSPLEKDFFVQIYIYLVFEEKTSNISSIREQQNIKNRGDGEFKYKNWLHCFTYGERDLGKIKELEIVNLGSCLCLSSNGNLCYKSFDLYVVGERINKEYAQECKINQLKKIISFKDKNIHYLNQKVTKLEQLLENKIKEEAKSDWIFFEQQIPPK